MIKYTGCQHYQVLSRILTDNNILQSNIGVEVGVRNGDTAEYLCRNHPKLLLWAVDPYLPYMDVGDYQFTQEEQSQIQLKARDRLKHYNVQWVYDVSTNAAGKMHPHGYDFVFIDANHEYTHVKEDINAWWPYIRSGGILSGHDYSMEGVKKAVTEFSVLLGAHQVLVGAHQVLVTETSADVWVIEK